ncbi:MAG TPA: type II toxin-antitoxin system RatA family toxin [Steroidobacteraceae bacterium]|nr:type II toxin-antitoxin system RatA family toxin [Steroidobacteraceae bacterium]
MKVVERSALVPYSAQQMYELVNDVDRYPQFLPWCTAAHVEPAAPGEVMASISVARGLLRTEFTTRNVLRPGVEITMRLVRGPFRRLLGHWRFEPQADRGSRVSFRVDFEFKSVLTSTALGPIFEALCGTIVDAFVVRARRVYSAAPLPPLADRC